PRIIPGLRVERQPWRRWLIRYEEPCPAAGDPHLVTPPSGSTAATAADGSAAAPREPPAVTPPPSIIGRLAAALSYRDFRILGMGACTSSIGTWMQEVAQNWLVLELTNSAKYLALDAFLGELPLLLFTLIGGVVADRQGRRQGVAVSQGRPTGCALTAD